MMTDRPRRHRHLIAFPLMLVILAGTFLHSVGNLRAEVTESIEDMNVGVGQRIVSSGLHQYSIGDLHLYSIDGAYFVAENGSSVTIASLTTPVFVQVSRAFMVVPVGWQWTISDTTLPALQGDLVAPWLEPRALTSIPQHFMERQMRELRTEPDRSVDLPPVRLEVPAPLWAYLHDLRLGAARERIEDEWSTEVLGTVRGALEQGDRALLTSLLYNQDFATVFDSRHGRLVLSTLLSQYNDDVTLAPIVEYLARDERLAVLFSLHPRWCSFSWTLPTPSSRELRLLRIFSFPFADSASVGMKPFTFQRWILDILTYAENNIDSPVLSFLFTTSIALVEYQESHGYPLRARLLASSLLELSEKYNGELPTDVESSLSDLRSLDRLDLSASLLPPVDDIVVEKEGEESTPREPTYTPDQVEALAESTLQNAGALFTVETTIDAVAPDTARVEGIVFAVPSGDRTFSFTYDVARDEISAVEGGGEEYPYSLTLDAFVKWLARF